MCTLLKRFKKHKTYNRNVFCNFSEKRSAHLHLLAKSFLQGAFDKMLKVIDAYKNIFWKGLNVVDEELRCGLGFPLHTNI